MKKLYSTPEYKKHCAIRRRNAERRVAEKKRAKKRPPHRNFVVSSNNGPLYRYKKPEAVKEKGNLVSIEVPEDFSIIENPEEMLSFFEELYANAKASRPVKLDLSSMKNLTPDSIVYMLSVFHYNKFVRGYSGVQGNFPTDERCNHLLSESGFFDYVHVPGGRPIPKETDVLSTKSDTKVQAEMAGKVISFSRERLGKHRDITSRAIYGTLIESMANTKHHAYANPTAHTKWWLIAVHDEEKKRVRFSFLDNGRGIPQTIRKRFKEKLVGSLLGAGSDADLLWSAMQGEFRSRTSQGYRGRGLPTIKDYAATGAVTDLKVISRRAFVDVSNNKRQDLDGVFRGTLLSWDFV